MANEPNTVHRLLVSDKAFEIMIRSIADHSRATRKFANLRDVVMAVVDEDLPVRSNDIERYCDIGSMEGTIQVWLRLTGDAVNAFDTFRDKMCQAYKAPCSVRDAVCFACLVSVKT
ncbi:hypothetical protein GCM10010990_35260 [Croceicoccus mobilis]|uniref:Uncharacterized protein n=1 Tax=Croceicoccus mobilis TaxID=1703339 RepID=A0A916Z990_9SPHN|nr:hypothetical protein GCM10010990_35260 [Croceicoccus mobilis]